MDKFYDNPYWKTGTGRQLLQLRRMIAFITHITHKDTPGPFFTWAENDMTGEWDELYHAEWSTLDNKDTMTVEYEQDVFFVFAHHWDDAQENLSYKFWFAFGDPEKSSEKDPLNDWSELEAAAEAASAWLEDNKDRLPERKLSSLF